MLGRTDGVDVAAGLPYAEAALRIDPDCYEANLFIGYLYLGERRFEDAVRVYEKAAALDLHAVRPLGMVCQAYGGLGDESGARDAARRTITRCEAALTLEPDHSEAIGFMVCALADLGEGERAREWVRRALLFDPDNGRLHYNLACALAQLGDVDAAVDLLETVAPTVNAAWLAWIERDNSLDRIRAAPRFVAFLEAAQRARTTTS